MLKRAELIERFVDIYILFVLMFATLLLMLAALVLIEEVLIDMFIEV